jgi:hypothetical protein
MVTDALSDPAAQDVVALCLACMGSSTSAMYQVPGDIAARFRLEPISCEEFEKLFREGVGDAEE